jgi:hypothetical protein
MRRAVLLLATMALAILLSGGVAQAIIEPAIINGEPDRGSKAHPYAGTYVVKFEGNFSRVLGYPNFSQSLPYRRALHGTSESKGSAEGTAYLRQFRPNL